MLSTSDARINKKQREFLEMHEHSHIVAVDIKPASPTIIPDVREFLILCVDLGVDEYGNHFGPYYLLPNCDMITLDSYYEKLDPKLFSRQTVKHVQPGDHLFKLEDHPFGKLMGRHIGRVTWCGNISIDPPNIGDRFVTYEDAERKEGSGWIMENNWVQY